jgi:hypothetical protein
MKVDEERKRKIMMAQRSQADRANIEDSLRQAKEEEVMNMERIEMELIKKIQNT